jgi:hypothetical protein
MKNKQKQLITEIINEDAKDGLYDNYKLQDDSAHILQLELMPFNIKFVWKNISAEVVLENGEDVLKLAQIFSDMLYANNIPNKIIYESNIINK